MRRERAQVDSGAGWVVVVATAMATFSVFGIAYSFWAVFPELRDEFGTDRGSAAFIFAITTFLYFMLGAFTGRLADRFGPRIVLLVGAAFMCAGMLLTSQVDRIEMAYLFYGVGVGVGVACAYVPMVAAVGGWFERRRTAALGVAVAGIGLGTLVGAPLTNWLVEQFNWRNTYVYLGVGGTAVLLLASLGARRPPASTQAVDMPPLGKLIRNARFAWLYLAMMMLSAALFIPFVYLGDYLDTYEKTGGEWLIGTIGAMSVVGRLGFGAIGTRVSLMRLYQFSFTTMGLSFLIWLFARDSYEALLAYAAIMGVSYGGFIALSPAVAAQVFGAVGLGGVLGALYTAAGIGGLLGPPFAGWMIDEIGFRATIFTALWVSLATVPLLVVTERLSVRHRRRLAAAEQAQFGPPGERSLTPEEDLASLMGEPAAVSLAPPAEPAAVSLAPPAEPAAARSPQPQAQPTVVSPAAAAVSPAPPAEPAAVPPTAALRTPPTAPPMAQPTPPAAPPTATPTAAPLRSEVAASSAAAEPAAVSPAPPAEPDRDVATAMARLSRPVVSSPRQSSRRNDGTRRQAEPTRALEPLDLDQLTALIELPKAADQRALVDAEGVVRSGDEGGGSVDAGAPAGRADAGGSQTQAGSAQVGTYEAQDRRIFPGAQFRRSLTPKPALRPVPPGITPRLNQFDSVLLGSFGGPYSAAEVRPFIQKVTEGRPISDERLRQVENQYLRLGGASPVNAQVRALAEALADVLARRGHPLPVHVGNRNWRPLFEDTLRAMTEAGHKHTVCVLTSAFSSHSGCRQYRDAIAAAREQLTDAPEVTQTRVYFNHPGFLQAMADRLVTARAGSHVSPESPAIFTAHSLPQAMADACDYEAQLADAAETVAELAGVEAYGVAYQSRSGRPETPWLEPTVDTALEVLAAGGEQAVLVVPLGFVSDNLELLWDLDVAARGTARRLGLTMVRVPTVGTHPLFVAALADLIEEAAGATAERPVLGSLAARPDVCAPGCCPLSV